MSAHTLNFRGRVEAAKVLGIDSVRRSTLIAAEKTGRSARVVEFDPTYCDRIVHRFETLTGKQAKLATTGESFEEAADMRLTGILSLNDKEEVQ